MKEPYHEVHCATWQWTERKKGRFTDLHFTVSYQQSKLIAIDKQPDDDVMHLG